MKMEKRYAEWAVSFWIGMGLMSLINVWKLGQGRNPLLYSWIMFGVSVIMIIAGLIFIKWKKTARPTKT
jgi:hypothetical protein